MASSTSLIPEQRRQEILRHLRREEVLSYRQITDLLGVSQMTARRDVALLAEQGRVTATAGGAAIVARRLSEPLRAQKAQTDLPQKTAISRAAAALVADSMTIYLDAGTTVQAMRPFLEDRSDLTVVTNDLTTVQAFLDHPSVDLICIGGRVDRDNQSTIGRLASLTLAELSVDVAFLSCSSWDARHGVTTPTEAKVDPKRAALHSATSSVLLADSGKYGSFAKYRIMRLDELDTVVTDDDLSSEDAEAIRAHDVEVVCAAIDDSAEAVMRAGGGVPS
ncbi:DeoR/GlpR family DNA-binding transcription regulator [Microbacterium hatanonis]|jgi:DeoR/GlpR family transcriptional regulator of sugar metabolism|uniref:DeoR/GlpR transcriptional regulator n=1 Tax=Microbacterium hatanonis TaxID=404366 RepID=A0A5C8I3I2_9MICO|nr:DeoR/GlpR family DNA-binding transcription regulator [Microbacterium hatanonis]TXK12899.1 DeoR/GlpR transcriptional regulator [Microbacterium hatanonis]